MSIISTANIHYVESIDVRRVKFSDFHSTEFTLKTKHGNTVSFVAFSEAPLVIEGAEFANFVAEHEGSEL